MKTGTTRIGRSQTLSTADLLAMIEHGRKMGVRDLSLKDGRLKVSYYPPEGAEIPAGKGDMEEKPKRSAARAEDRTGGLLSAEDARILMEPYHDIHE